MDKDKKDRIVKLITDYLSEYNEQEHPFLLFDLAHVNENDHTRALLGILKYNNLQFLPSFIQAIGAPVFKKAEVNPTDQRKAIGNKGTGFIDLYFEYLSIEGKKEKIIIENKVYGAGDTYRQLARYIASALDPNMNDADFGKIWELWYRGEAAEEIEANELNHIHVIYLTSDGGKKPDINSLPKYFGNNKGDIGFEAENIRYYPINYIKDIIPWLENDVLPNMPYADDGIAIAGVRQYIASLKAMFLSKGNSEVIDKYFGDLNITNDKDKYDTIMEVMNVVKSLEDKKKRSKYPEIVKELKELGIDVDDSPELHSLSRELRTAAMSIFSKDGDKLGDGWKFYFTPSFIFLYKQSWADLDTRKYSIPSIYLVADTPKLLEGKQINWNLQVDHLDSNFTKKRKTNSS